MSERLTDEEWAKFRAGEDLWDRNDWLVAGGEEQGR